MSVEYIRYRLDGFETEAFEDAYRRAAEELALAPECIDYELTRCEEEPSSYILRIRWTSTRDHLEGFRRGERFGPFLSEIRAYMPAIQEMRHYASTGVQGQGGARPA